MKTHLRPLLVLALAGLAACSNSEREEAPVENTAAVEEVPAPVEPPPVTETPPPAETTADANAAVPASEEPSADEQMLDDASATGMTARSSRGEAEEATETQAAENETE